MSFTHSPVGVPAGAPRYLVERTGRFGPVAPEYSRRVFASEFVRACQLARDMSGNLPAREYVWVYDTRAALVLVAYREGRDFLATNSLPRRRYDVRRSG